MNRNYHLQERISKHFKSIMIILGILLVAAMLILLSVGRYHIGINSILHTFMDCLIHPGAISESNDSIILLNIRLPRILLAALVGASLSLSGCTFQCIFHNPMASPDMLGASSGACFGAALAIMLNLGHLGITVVAFSFSLITVVLVYFVSTRSPGNRILSLILSGIMIGSLFSAATSYIKLVCDPNNQLPAITYWMMGSLSGATISSVILSLIPMVLAFIILLGLRWRMNLLSLSEDEIETMGVNANRLRIIGIVMASLLTASSIAVSGMIGWIGLVIPNLSRKLAGDDVKKIMPLSLLLGALFLLIVDGFSRNLFATEIPIGILNAFIGAPFFIGILLGKK